MQGWRKNNTTFREGMGMAAVARGICTAWCRVWNCWLGNPCPDDAWFPAWLWPPALPCIPSVSFPWGNWPGLLNCGQ